MKMKFLVLFVLMVFQTQAFAKVGEHCLVKPKDIEALTNRMLVAHQEEKKIFPDSSVIQFEAEGSLSGNGSQQDGTFEGIFRPEQDGYFSLTPLPILVVELNRTRELIYVCAHASSQNPQENYFMIYFLRGYNMGPSNLSSFFGDLVFNSVKVKPVGIVPLGLIAFKNIFKGHGSFNPLGLFLIPIEVTQAVQNGLSNAISTFSKVGVERIIVTKDNIELASGVKLETPEKVLYRKNIPLK